MRIRPKQKRGTTRNDEPTTLADLVDDPKNARRHGERNLAMISASLEAVGAARSIVIDEGVRVLAGCATREQALAKGMKLRVIEGDPNTLIAVRRRGLTPRQKALLALYDNRTAEVADGWDPAMLRDLQDQGVLLEQLWTTDELVEVLGGVVYPGLTPPDELPALRPTSIVPGHVFALGNHRLVCGDSTNPDIVRAALGRRTPALMVTDPPYGVNYRPEWRRDAGVNRSNRMGTVDNDDRADWSEAWALFPGDVAYIWHAGRFASVVQDSLEASNFDVWAQIIWRKNRIVLSRGHYHWQHEPCWYAVRRGRSGLWAGKRNQSTVWPIAGTLHQCQRCGSVEADETIEALPSTVWDVASRDATGDTTHGTQKPVDCMARAMRNHRAPVVYEPFAGSGTSLIAAEMLGRTCLAIELKPDYVQQTIDRWEAFTGRKAKKLGDARLTQTG